MRYKLLLSIAILAAGQQSFADATYSVPTTDALKSYSQFTIADPQIAVQGSSDATLTYNLPPELVGPNASSIVLNGSAAVYNGSATFQLTGDQADANCAVDEGVSTCNIRFKNLGINKPAVKSFLQQISKTPLELSARNQVFASFEGDPHGILIYGNPVLKP